MSFPRQDSVAARLQRMNIKIMTGKMDNAKADVDVLWRQAERLLKADIAAAYSASSPRGGRWDLTSLQAGGTFSKLSMRAGNVLQDFMKRSTWKIERSLKELRHESARRHAWVLDQVTPDSFRVKVTKNVPNMHEADRPLTSGFPERWSEWVQGYHQALLRNLRMNALNGGSLQDALDEVDATRVSTPAYTIDSALDRLWEYYAWDAVTGGMHQAVDDNGDAGIEIWKTSGDLRVCDECDANEGLPIDEADGTIPLHPNCNCFPQIVPASYAALLRGGDEDARDLAAQMDAEGVAPNAIVIRGADGQIKGRAIVDFGDWEAAQGLAVAGGM